MTDADKAAVRGYEAVAQLAAERDALLEDLQRVAAERDDAIVERDAATAVIAKQAELHLAELRIFTEARDEAKHACRALTAENERLRGVLEAARAVRHQQQLAAVAEGWDHEQRPAEWLALLDAFDRLDTPESTPARPPRDPEDLRIEYYRGSDQPVNASASGARVTHMPTGIVAECSVDRSRHRNLITALKFLDARLDARQREKPCECASWGWTPTPTDDMIAAMHHPECPRRGYRDESK